METRIAFGPWGRELDDARFAMALAAAGVYDALQLQPPTDAAAVETALRRALDDRGAPEEHIRPPIVFETGRLFDSILAGKKLLDASEFAAAWDAVMQWERTRIEVRLADKDQLDPFWIVRELSRREVNARSVYIDAGVARSPVRWEWPLRVAYLPDEASTELIVALRDSRYGRLFRLVEAAGSRDSDLLLVPATLENAPQLLPASAPLRSDCVLLLGGFDGRAADAPHHLKEIGEGVINGGIGVVSIAHHLAWFDLLLANLSHNEPIDVALYNASREFRQAPVAFFTRDLVRATRIEFFKRRLGNYIASKAPKIDLTLPDDIAQILGVPATASAETIGEALRDVDLPFNAESEGATLIARTREAVEEQIGSISVRSLRARRGQRGRPREAAEVLELMTEQPPKPRRVQAAFFEGDRFNPEKRARKALRPRSYTIAVRIAASDIGWAALAKAFPQEKLPPSASGHELNIVLYEHPAPGEETMPQPQLDTLHLPPTGDTREALFFTNIEAGRTEYSARIAVLFGNRVLQTMMLRADVVADPATAPRDSIRLEEIVAVQSSFDAIEARPENGGVIILNRTDGGIEAVQAFFANRPIAFRAPQDIRDATANVALVLKELERREELPLPGAADELLRTTLIDLALLGSSQLTSLLGATGGVFAQLAGVEPLQVVEAHFGSFLPLEFLYGRDAPDDDARICEHGVAALASGDMAVACPNADEEVVCPASFWGFSRVIERFPTAVVDSGDVAVGSPTAIRKRLPVLSGALVGVSDKVDAADRQKTLDAVKRFAANTNEASSWDEWKTLVKDHSPTLMVLLPHSMDDPERIAAPSLEIRGIPLAHGRLSPKYVRGPACTDGPLVLLLGCTTGLTDSGFQNFVSGFKVHGAAVVVGTLSKVLGRHAARFVETFLNELIEQSRKPGTNFGAAVLRTKQRLLAAKHPFALTLLAYGDAGWELQ